MPTTYSTDGVILAKVMRDYLNTWAKRPCDIRLEELTNKTPCMMLQQLSSAEVLRNYINGSYIGRWDFAVYIRVSGKDTASRFDAIACLDNLSAWLTEVDQLGAFVRLPIIDACRQATAIRLSGSPSLAARYEDGTEAYQAIYRLEYKFSRRI